MSEIESCPFCESPLVDSALERAFDGLPFRRCCNRDCGVIHDGMTASQRVEYRKYLASPAGTARMLVEARAEIARMKSDDKTRDALIETLQRERDAALAEATMYKNASYASFKGIMGACDERDNLETKLAAAESQIAALKVDLAAMTKERDEERGEHRGQEQMFAMQYDDMRAARDAALADLSQARAELLRCETSCTAMKGACNDALDRLRGKWQEAEKKLNRAWSSLGTTAEDAADDPETADLADSIRVSLQYERDQRDESREAIARVEQERDSLREEIARLKADNLERHRRHGAMHSRALQAEARAEGFEAALGSAVAALRELTCNGCSLRIGFMGARGYDGSRNNCAHCMNARAILADAESTAAGEAYERERDERAELKAKNERLNALIADAEFSAYTGSLDDCETERDSLRRFIEQHMHVDDCDCGYCIDARDTLAKVDARRAGKPACQQCKLLPGDGTAKCDDCRATETIKAALFGDARRAGGKDGDR